MSGTLFLVPTPIGNLGDLSPRAAQVLAQVDVVAAEDTRVTLKLLNHLGLKKPMVSYYRHNTQELRPSVDGLLECLIVFNAPFTLLKGALTALLCFLVYKPLSPILHGVKK